MIASFTETLYSALFVGFGVSVVISFAYMVKKRGFFSALIWSFIPCRSQLSTAIDVPFDDNPIWLDFVQLAFIVAFGLLWLWRKVNS